MPAAVPVQNNANGAERIRALLGDWLLPAWFLGFALFFAATAACTLLNYALRQPTFDQYKEYAAYLSHPFLDSVLNVENGHHPVFPALLANIEIALFHANQYLQLGVGSACVFVTVALLAFIAWRHEMPRPARAAGVMLAVLGVLWLANARMLLQGVGQLQIYLVMLSVIIAMWATWIAAQKDSWTATGTASTASAVAMFTFGAGVAAFPTVLVLGFLLRLRWQKLLLLLLAFALCLVLYIYVLPGHEGVRNSLALRPLDSFATAAQWLSSPWANAFFGLADPPLQPWLTQNFRHTEIVGPLLTRMANTLVAGTGWRWQSISTIFGIAGLLTFVLLLLRRLVRRVPFLRYTAIATGLCIFGAMTAAIIGIGRLDYLAGNPNQVFADRYLGWPCLFWMGLMLLLLDEICQRELRARAALLVLPLILLPVLLLPTHRGWAGWAASMHQLAQRSAAAARSDVFDAAVFPEGDDAGREDVLRTLSLLKENRLAMFADSGWQLLGTSIVETAPVREITLTAHVMDTLRDGVSDLPAASVEGELTQGMALVRGTQLVIVDDTQRVCGIAEFSFASRESDHPLRLHLPRKRGFDGYIRDYHAERSYRVAVLRAETHVLLAQTPVEARQP